MAAKPKAERRGTDREAAQASKPQAARRILLASTGSPFDEKVIGRALELAAPEGAKVTVLSVARVWGTSLGLPHPGLQPTPLEWEAQREIVTRASKIIRRRGLPVTVKLIRARNAPKQIARWAEHLRSQAIVMADPELPGWRRIVEGTAWRDVARRTRIPVHAVPTAPDVRPSWRPRRTRS